MLIRVATRGRLVTTVLSACHTTTQPFSKPVLLAAKELTDPVDKNPDVG